MKKQWSEEQNKRAKAEFRKSGSRPLRRGPGAARALLALHGVVDHVS
jgi:hypothetical protein